MALFYYVFRCKLRNCITLLVYLASGGTILWVMCMRFAGSIEGWMSILSCVVMSSCISCYLMQIWKKGHCWIFFLKRDFLYETVASSDSSSLLDLPNVCWVYIWQVSSVTGFLEAARKFWGCPFLWLLQNCLTAVSGLVIWDFVKYFGVAKVCCG